jgi:4-methoxybenzoate monooxygenase (O-demethylating)
VLTLPSLDIDPYTDEVLAEPFEFYRLVRETGPVVRVQQSEGFDLVAVGRDRDVRAIFEDPDVFISSRGNGAYDIAQGQHFREPAVLVENDPPQHTAIRAVMTDVLSPRNTRRLRDDFQKAADEVVDRLLDLRTFDAQREFAEAFPLRVVPDFVMGAPHTGRENLLKYSVFLFESMGPRTPRAAEVLSRLDGLEAAIAWVAESCSRDNVAPESLGALLWAAADRGEIQESQAANLVRSLLGAGIDTTIHSLANTLELLVRHPDQWQFLHEQPARARFAFEEAIRFDSTARQNFRTPIHDTEIDGIPVREGQKIMLLIGAANRDPERWGETADTFDVSRNASGHLSFGRGIHACVGALIARLEADVLLSTFARRVGSVEFAGTPVRMLNNSLRGWTSLPVTVTPA